jgi:hypothetical protein
MRWLVSLVGLACVACSSAAAPTDLGGTGEQGGKDTGTPAPDAGGGHDGGDAGGPADAHPEGSPGPDAPTPDAAGEAAGPSDAGPVIKAWTPVSFGVTTKDANGGADIVIAYGGYTATDADSQAWVSQMTSVRLAQLGVGHMYAVRGPKEADYSSREIGNSELAAVLATQAQAATRVVVIAHSSGGFVADELFTFVDASVMAKMTYFNLDGGSWALTDAMVGTMRGVYFCSAHDAKAGNSENTSSDETLHADFAGSHYFVVDADGSGCNVGAGWCLHDTLVIDRPHDPATFDLALDYTDFTGGRQVVTSYVDQAVADGAL